MILRNDRFTVTIQVESMPPLELFDIVYNPGETDTGDYYSARLIRIESKGGNRRCIALVDRVTPGYEPCAVLEEDILTVIQYDAIVRIDLNTGAMVQWVECGSMGGLFEFHAVPDGYIIWGEGEVYRYDPALNRVWWRSGRDILVSPTGAKSFWIEGDRIHYRDWEGWHYVVDMDGNAISDTREMIPED